MRTVEMSQMEPAMRPAQWIPRMADRYRSANDRKEVDMHPFGLAMAGHDVDTAVPLLAADVEFRSPVVFAPYRGRDAVAPLLYAVADVLRDFRYTRQIGAPDARDLALVFPARAGGTQIEGCDFLHLDDAGLIDELFVMIRPMSGVQALAKAMTARLGAAHDSRRPT